MAVTIDGVPRKFGIEKEKVVSLTTDIANPIMGIGDNENLGIKQPECYVQIAFCHSRLFFSKIFDPMEPVFVVIQKIKRIVTFFHFSCLATAVLKKELKIIVRLSTY